MEAPDQQLLEALLDKTEGFLVEPDGQRMRRTRTVRLILSQRRVTTAA